MATAAPGTASSSGVASWKNSFKDSQAHLLNSEMRLRFPDHVEDRLRANIA